MKIIPTLEECKKIAAEGSYGVIPISTEMYADMTTPIEVLRILKKVSGHVYLLESAEGILFFCNGGMKKIFLEVMVTDER